MTRTPSNTDNLIDSRDINNRIEELESELTGHLDTLAEFFPDDEDTQEDFTQGRVDPSQARGYQPGTLEGVTDPDERSEILAEYNEAVEDWESWESIEMDELEALRSLRDEGEQSPDWNHGETLIHDDYFTEYAQQLAEDIGAIDSDQGWPGRCIDWEQAAKELQTDYFSVDFDGETYWIRG